MNGRPWKPEHTKLMELMISLGCTHDLIASHTGHCVGTVKQRASCLGLKVSNGIRYRSWEDLTPSALKAIKDLTS